MPVLAISRLHQEVVSAVYSMLPSEMAIKVKPRDQAHRRGQDVRDNIITYHSQWFKKIEQMLANVGEEPSVPRRCGRQCHCSNVPADTPCEYYCCCISIPVLDHLLSEMESCFSSHQQTALLGLSVYHPSLYLSLQKSTPKSMQLANMYNDIKPMTLVYGSWNSQIKFQDLGGNRTHTSTTPV